MRLKDKIVFITGASSGIGKACAEIFAQEGTNLILLARRKQRIDSLGEELKSKYGIEVLTFSCDVRILSQVENVINSLPDKFKSIDILINNAGLAKGMDKIQNGKIEYFDEMIDTNVKGLLYVSRLLIPIMIKKGNGMIFNIASIAGREVYPNGNVYCASKSAVRALSEAMQIDMNGTGIRITNIDPGMVETEFSLVRFDGDADRAKQVYRGLNPLTANDIAELVLFCATRPDHVNISDVKIMPTDQASTYISHRKQ